MIQTVIRFFRSINWRSRRTRITLGALVVVAFIALRALSGGETITAEENKRDRSIEVATVADLMSGGTTLSIVGEVESRSEATIRAESAGRITRVNVALGDRVAAGRILAEIENSSQRAAVLQAEGAYDAAKATLQKIQGGTRDEQLALLQTGANSARSGAVNTLLSAYAAVDNAIKDSTDQIFSNTEGPNPQLNVSTSDSQAKLDVQNTRAQLNALLNRQAALSTTLSTSNDLDTELTRTEEELRTVRTYLDSVVRVLNAGVAVAPYNDAAIAGFKADAIAARTSINGALSSIASARSAIESAEKNLEQGVTGAQTEDIAATQASVKQAQGAYNAALAALEKTLVRSPIAGTINNFDIKLGDVVSPTQQVAVVSNNGALEAVAYISEDDKNTISVGSKAVIEGGYEGTVTKIAPALDPVTRRIEVKIGLPQNATETLTNGQSVRITIARTGANTAAAPTKATKILIPITAIKLEADRSVVFTVNSENKLVATAVTLGSVTGSSMEVLEGLDMQTEIVTDARGLKEGDTVSVDR